MPRYLQKLVARAGVAPLPASLQPAPRAEHAEFGAAGALPEVVEPLVPDSPALSETGATVLPVAGSLPEAAESTIEMNAEAIPPAQQVIRERTTELVREDRVEPRVPQKERTQREEIRPAAELRVEPSQTAKVPRVEPTLVPAIDQEVPPAVTVITQPKARQTLAQKAGFPQLQAAQERPAEQDLLSKLMPRLEAWFNHPSPGEAQPESHGPEPRLGPPHREPEISPLLRQEEPRLVIGQIRVDVLPAPPPASPLQVVRIQARSSLSPASAGTIAKLGFGLGQM
jgi:hypothetical protein